VHKKYQRKQSSPYMMHMTTKTSKKKVFNTVTEASFLEIHVSHPLLTTYISKYYPNIKRHFYNIPCSPNLLKSQMHKVCLTVKSCVYSPIFLARCQPGLSLVYLKSIEKNQICTRLFGCMMDHTSCA